MKPITTESTISVKPVLSDPANLLSVNSLDGRIQLVGKASGTETFAVFPNADGSTVGITFPAGYNGMFILPVVGNISGFTSSSVSTGLNNYFFISNGVASLNNPSFNVTLTSSSNGGKLYFINNSGLLAKVSNSSTLRTNYGINKSTNIWEIKGILFEPSTYNLITTTWNGLTYGAFGATGATAGITTGFGLGYWDTNTIPQGMTVWALTEITAGPNKENTIIVPASAINFMNSSGGQKLRPFSNSIQNSYFPNTGAQFPGFTGVFYDANTGITGPGPTGTITWNNTNQSLATKLFVHTSDRTPTNRSALLSSLKIDDVIVMQTSTASSWSKSVINAAPISGVTYFEFPITRLSGLSTFSDQNIITFGPHMPFTNFNFQAFFKSGDTVGGITKNLVQIWALTDTVGSIKKSVYYDITDCNVVSVSSGGTTFAWYNTEPLANGWCRCTLGVGLTGTTYAAWDGFGMFGFSTARPDGAGGFTFGNLLGTSAGNLYFSGIKVDWSNFPNNAAVYYSNKLSPTQYTDPRADALYPNDSVLWTIPYSQNDFFQTDFSQQGRNTVFLESVINGPIGISGDDTGSGVGFSSIILKNGNTVVNNLHGLVTGVGMRLSGYWTSPAPSGVLYTTNYSGQAVPGTRFDRYVRTNSVGLNRGYTLGEMFKLSFSGFSGAFNAFFNGFTGDMVTIAAKDMSNTGLPTTGEITISHNIRDKIINIKNYAFSGVGLTYTQGINLTSFISQGAPIFRFLGTDGGHNGTGFVAYSSANQIVSTNNTTPPLSTGRYPKQPVDVVP